MVPINIDGNDYELIEDGTSEQASEDVGGVRRDAADGTPRSSVVRERRVYNLAFWRMSNATLNTLRASLARGRAFPITGPYVPAGNYTGQVTNAGFIHEGTGFLRGVTASIKQV